MAWFRENNIAVLKMGDYFSRELTKQYEFNSEEICSMSMKICNKGDIIYPFFSILSLAGEEGAGVLAPGVLRLWQRNFEGPQRGLITSI